MPNSHSHTESTPQDLMDSIAIVTPCSFVTPRWGSTGTFQRLIAEYRASSFFVESHFIPKHFPIKRYIVHVITCVDNIPDSNDVLNCTVLCLQWLMVMAFSFDYIQEVLFVGGKYMSALTSK